METIQAQITLDNAKAIQELQRLNQTITNSFQSLSKTLGDSLGKVDGKTAGQKIANDISSEGKKAGVSFGDLFKSSLLASLASSGIQAAISKTMDFGKSFFDASSQMEDYRASFGALVGDVKVGGELLGQIYDMASKTPFETTELASSAQLLLQYNVAQKDVLDTLSRLGDASGGNAVKMNSLALAYGQVNAAGKATMGDINQMINAGFNPLNVIAQKTGKSMGELRGEVEKGAVSSQMIKDAFIVATSAGGQFYGMMEAKSKTVSGRLSTFSDQIKTIGMSIMGVSKTGEILQGGLFDVISNGIDFVAQKLAMVNWEEVGGKIRVSLIFVFEALNNSVKFVSDNFTLFSSTVQAIMPNLIQAGSSFGILALAIGGVVAIFVAFPTILSIAAASIPIFTAGLAMIPTAIGFVISSIAFIGTAIMGIWPIIFGIGPMIMSMIPAFFTLAGAIFSSIIPTIMAVATTIFTSLIPAIFSIIPSLFATIGGFIMWAGAAIMSAGATLLAMLPVILTIGLIAAVVGLLFKAWSSNWMGIKDITASIIGGIIPFLQTAFKFILDVVAGTMKAILSVITSILGFVVNVVADSLAVVTGFFFDGFFAMEDIVTGFMDVLAGLFSGDLSKVVQGFGKVFAGIIGLAAAPVKAVVKAVESGLNLIIDMINGVTQNDVVKGVLEKFGMKVGKMNPLDFAKDFDKKVTDAQAGAVGIGGETAQKEYEKKASERAGQKEAAMSAIKDGAKAVTGAMDGANSAIQGAIDSANSALKNAPGELAKGLQGLGQSIADNIGKLNPMEEMQKKQQEMQDKMKADQEKMKSDQDKMKADMDKQKADAEANLQKAQFSQPKGAGGGGGKSEAEKQADEAKKLAEQKAKDEANAQKEIEKLKVANIKNDADRQKASLDLQAKNDLENFKGSESQKAEFAKLQAENVAKEKAEIDKKLAEQSQKEAEKTQKEQIQQQKEVAKTGEQYDNLIGRLSTLNQKQAEYTDKTKESTKIADSQKIADIRDQLAKLGTANFGQMGIITGDTAPTPATTPTTPINQGQVILSKEQPQAQNQPPADPATLTQPIDDTAKKTSEGIDTLIEKIKTGISGAISEGSKAIIEEITKMDEEVVKIFNLVNEGWITIAQAIGQNVITGIISGLQKGERSIYSAIASLETSALRAVNIEVKSREEFGDEGRGAALGVPSVMNPNVEFMRSFKPYSAGSQTNNQAQNNQKTANFGDININNNTDFDVFKGQLNGIFVG